MRTVTPAGEVGAPRPLGLITRQAVAQELHVAKAAYLQMSGLVADTLARWGSRYPDLAALCEALQRELADQGPALNAALDLLLQQGPRTGEHPSEATRK